MNTLLLAILDKTETLLGFLNPDIVQIEETNEYQGLRTIEITHPITTADEDVSSLILPGNKVWRQETSDGDSCLYVMLENLEIDSENNTISITAEEVATELSMLPPTEFTDYVFYTDDFEDGIYTGRSSPYRDVSQVVGTISIDNSNGYGNYCIKHVGTGNNTQCGGYYNGFPLPDNFIIDLKVRLLTEGTNAACPYISILYIQYINYKDWLRVDSIWDGSNQLIRLVSSTSGVLTTIASATLKTGSKWTVNEWMWFRVQRDSANGPWKIYRLWIKNKPTLLLEVETANPGHTAYFGFGSQYNTVAVWDEIVRHDMDTINDISVDESFLSNIYGSQFDIGTVEGTETFNYNGVITPMALIREIEAQTGYEFQFRYEYNPATKKIERYLDFLERRGKTHNTPIEIGYNTDNIIYTLDEAEVGIAATPTGNAGDDNEGKTNFHKARYDWLKLEVNPEVQIPLWATKDQDDNWIYGPLTYPPYPKNVDENFVYSSSEDSAASYVEIQGKAGSETSIERMVIFESSEEHPYNLYWLCVDKIREKQQPTVQLVADIADIRDLVEDDPQYFNVGDTMYLKLPGSLELIECRIMKTTKNPRQRGKDNIELGNHHINFFADYLDVKVRRNMGFETPL